LIIADIRPCQAGHVPELERIDSLCGSPAWGRGPFLHHVASDAGGMVLGAFLKGELRGFLAWEMRGEEAWILRLGVHPEFRRLGLASQLICALEVLALSQGCARLCLHVRSWNHPARALYLSMGFRSMGVQEGYYSDGEAGELMTASLPLEVLEDL